MALREDYRELLLEAAVLVVSRDGLDHATTKAIAKEAACNEVYIYRNFGSKEGLLQAAFDRADIHFIQMVIKHLDVLDDRSMTLEQRCHALWQPVWAFCLSGPDIIRLLLFRAVPDQRPRAAPPQLPAAAGAAEPLFYFRARLLAADGPHLRDHPQLRLARAVRRSRGDAGAERAGVWPGLPHAAAIYAAVSADPNLLPPCFIPLKFETCVLGGQSFCPPGDFFREILHRPLTFEKNLL